MEIEVNVITLEDGKDYMIVEALKSEKNKYLFLANKDDAKDLMIRKIIKEDEKEYVVKLDDEDEFEEALTLFNNKHNKGENK